MQGVTTAVVAFILACVLFPHVIKNKPQYYGALAAVLVVILLDAIAAMTGPASGFRTVAYLLIALLQIGSIFLLILSTGGLSVRELAGELADTIEVVRRGESGKEIIVPLRGEIPKPRRPREEIADSAIDVEGEKEARPDPSPRRTREDDSSLPLE